MKTPARIALATAGTATAITWLIAGRWLTAPAPEVNAPPTATTSPDSSASYTGQAASTRYGDVQVRITVEAAKITDIEVIEYPASNPRDQQINAAAIPQLVQEGLSAQSADVQAVSGATYTSQGYRTSLQSAIDQAGL